MGRSTEINSANRDCVGESSKSGTVNGVFTKVWLQNAFILWFGMYASGTS